MRPDVAVDDGVPGAVCPIGQVHAPQSTAASGAAPARPWLGGRRPDPCQLASPRGHPSCRVSPAAPDAWRVQLETRVAGGTPSPAPSPWTWLSNTSAAQQPLVVAPPLSLARAAGSCQRTFYVPPQPGSHEVHSSRLTACTVPPVLGRRMQHSFRRRLLRQRLPRAFRGHPLKRAVCAVRGGPTRALRWMHGEAVGARRPPSDRGGHTELERSVEGPRRRRAAAADPPERRQPTGRRRRRASGGAALGVAHLAGVGGGRGRWRRACRSAHEAAGDGGPDGGPTRTLGGAARRAAATTTGDRVR